MIKIERSFPAPESLAIEAQKISGSYEKEDVVERLIKDFHNKCYICEMDKLQDPQVEHLLPHKNGKYPDRKFDWNNLFWSCGHCNGIKNQEKYDVGIIDCCKIDPEQVMIFRLKEEMVQILARDKKNVQAVLTAELITEVFDKKNTAMRIYKSDMRFQQLNQEMNKLYDSIEELQDNPESKFALKKIKALLRKESRFAAFKRNYIRENRQKYPLLLQYIS